jgi:hypothetical protein
LYGLVELKVNGDGNCQVYLKFFSFSFREYCVSRQYKNLTTSTYLFTDLPFKQFRALSDQFYRTPEHHRFVRQQVMTQVSILNMANFICLSLQGEVTTTMILSVNTPT